MACKNKLYCPPPQSCTWCNRMFPSSVAVFISVHNWGIPDPGILCWQTWIAIFSRYYPWFARTKNIHCNTDFSCLLYVWVYYYIHDCDWWSAGKGYVNFLFLCYPSTCIVSHSFMPFMFAYQPVLCHDLNVVSGLLCSFSTVCHFVIFGRSFIAVPVAFQCGVVLMMEVSWRVTLPI